MPFPDENAAFETWLRMQCEVVEPDLKAKHKRMTESPFDFLRATFFRWASTIAAICPELADAPAVLSVGDLHVENFGTWRDAEGRLVWGINDFDEAAVIPFAFDLVRLATSARLAPDPQISNRDAANAILDGYCRGLRNPRPTLLDEQETWMRPLVGCSEKDRTKFWRDVKGDPAPTNPVPDAVERGLRASLPSGAVIKRFATRRRGGGSLGRPRYVATAAWRGGHVVREAKALVPSAWDWAHGDADAQTRFNELVTGPSRSPDPFLSVQNGFIFRRIAADARKVEFGPDAELELHRKLLEAMGFDLGAVHGSAPAAAAISDRLDRLQPGWLRRASKNAVATVKADYQAWKDHVKGG